jgi:hypothetical protein
MGILTFNAGLAGQDKAGQENTDNHRDVNGSHRFICESQIN